MRGNQQRYVTKEMRSIRVFLVLCPLCSYKVIVDVVIRDVVFRGNMFFVYW